MDGDNFENWTDFDLSPAPNRQTITAVAYLKQAGQLRQKLAVE